MEMCTRYLCVYSNSVYDSAANLQLSISVQTGCNFADFGMYLRTAMPG